MDDEEEGGHEGEEEAFVDVEVESADEEGEDDEELLDEDDLDGEDLDDEVASRGNAAVASKTPVRRRLKVCICVGERENIHVHMCPAWASLLSISFRSHVCDLSARVPFLVACRSRLSMTALFPCFLLKYHPSTHSITTLPSLPPLTPAQGRPQESPGRAQAFQVPLHPLLDRTPRIYQAATPPPSQSHGDHVQDR